MICHAFVGLRTSVQHVLIYKALCCVLNNWEQFPVTQQQQQQQQGFLHLFHSGKTCLSLEMLKKYSDPRTLPQVGWRWTRCQVTGAYFFVYFELPLHFRGSDQAGNLEETLPFRR